MKKFITITFVVTFLFLLTTAAMRAKERASQDGTPATKSNPVKKAKAEDKTTTVLQPVQP